MIKFRMDPVWLTIVVSCWSGILLILVFSAGPYWSDPLVIASAAFFILAILDVLFGTYLTLNGREFSRTDYFFRKRKIGITDITGMRYAPTWKLGQQSLRSLIVDGIENGQPKYVDIPNNGFAEKNLAKIASELKKRNPSIKMDEHTGALIKKYESTS